jgi:ribonuclease Z
MRAEALGVPFGPERGSLVRGEAVTLADGRTIEPHEVLGEEIAGTRYVHVGDAGRTDNLLEVCRGASALTIESTYVQEEAELARKFGHLTAYQAARLAREANIDALILTHLSRRYFGHEVRSEAQVVFPDTFVARDLDHFQIGRDGVRRLQNRRSGHEHEVQDA